MASSEEARRRLKPDTSCVGTSLWPASRGEMYRTSSPSPAGWMAATLSSPPPPVLNGITVAGRLERLEEGGRVGRGGGSDL